MVNFSSLFLCVLLLAAMLLASACDPRQADPTPDIDATVEAQISATVDAAKATPEQVQRAAVATARTPVTAPVPQQNPQATVEGQHRATPEAPTPYSLPTSTLFPTPTLSPDSATPMIVPTPMPTPTSTPEPTPVPAPMPKPTSIPRQLPTTTPTARPFTTPPPTSTPVSAVDLDVSLWTENNQIIPGKELTIEYTVVNHGPQTDEGVTLEFSHNRLFVPLSTSPETRCVNNVCDLAAFGANESVSGKFIVRPEVSLGLDIDSPLVIGVRANGMRLDLDQTNNEDSLQFVFSKDEPGYLLWSTSIPSAGKPAGGRPVVGEAVYFGANDDIYAVSKTTGQVLWQYELNDSAYPIGLYKDALIVTDGDIYSIDSTAGSVNWRFINNLDSRWGPWTRMFDDTIYLSTRERHIYAIDATTGRLKWDYYSESSATFGWTVAVDEEAVYFGQYKTLRSLDAATGKVNWEYEADSHIEFYIRPAISGGAIYFATDRSLYTLDKETGKELIIRHINQLFESDESGTEDLYISSGILSDGRLYLAANNLDVVALDYELSLIYWDYRFEGERPAGWSSGYVRHIRDDKIYLLVSNAETNDGQPLDGVDGIYALGAVDGTLLWHFESVLGAFVNTALHEDVVYMETYDGYLETIDAATGELRRRFNVERMYTGIDFTISDGVLYGLEGSHVFALAAER